MTCSLTACLLACSAGVSAHLGIFIKDDWDRHAVTLFHVFIAAPVIGFGLAIFLVDWSYLLKQQPRCSASVRGSACPYSGTDTFSTHWAVFQALGKHVSARYGPSPMLSSRRNGTFALTVSTASTVILYESVYLLEPNEISINNPGAIKEIHDIHTKCTKAPFTM
ncbi:hypothetical protein BJX65DRAFT_303398 [Aspergillus insuetus]